MNLLFRSPKWVYLRTQISPTLYDRLIACYGSEALALKECRLRWQTVCDSLSSDMRARNGKSDAYIADDVGF